ncbi:MAG: SDR family NAD(P)-dependent oxidoreductase [Solirubrobacterales bacterium]
MNLDGKTVLLTGATGGLGRAIAAALAGRGATLVLSSRKPDELADLAASLPGEGHRTIVADLAEEGAAERVVAEAGELDVLVANAGLGTPGRFREVGPEQIADLVRVNLEAPIRMARAASGPMRERGSGHVVLIASLAAKAVNARSSLYSATKAGLRTFGLGLRKDLARDGVGVSVVSPGFIRDAGMFARGGANPGLFGTSSPEEVGEGVAAAIERDRAEVEVAPIAQRVGANFAHRRPRIAGRFY